LRLERFLEPACFDPLLFSGRGLHLLPDGPAARHAYAVLCRAMAERSRWAVGRMVLGGQRQVVLIRPAGSVLVLHVLHYPELVRACGFSGYSPADATGEELLLAGQLIDAASGAVDWASYRDETAQELRVLIEAKIQGRSAEEESAPLILPLLQALQQSVAATPAGAVEVPARRKTPTARKRQRTA
jgi:non-homologous end joining protein Ku